MTKTNLIHICSDETVKWFSLSAEGSIAQQGEVSSLADLSLTAAAQLVVLIPGQYVTTMVVKMPKMARSEMLAAIPYALEDKLAQNVEQLFFAVGERDKQGNVAVAVIAHDKIQNSLKA